MILIFLDPVSWLMIANYLIQLVGMPCFWYLDLKTLMATVSSVSLL